MKSNLWAKKRDGLYLVLFDLLSVNFSNQILKTFEAGLGFRGSRTRLQGGQQGPKEVKQLGHRIRGAIGASQWRDVGDKKG